ncbi:MAG TPA: carbohydrate binding family 9 domain-containing protein, partial [Gemmatimonadaceae bacterium]
MRASRLTGSIRIDGKLNEPAWATAVPSGDFMESYPNVGGKPTDATEVRVLYDDDAIYVGVRMFDSHPDSIAAQLARRDASGIYSDWLHVMIDSYRDRRTSFRFSVNPRGVQKDVLEYDDRNGEDLNWDAVWEVATTVDSLGWTAEYRIPFSQLRFGGKQKGVERIWGFQVMRDIAR